MSSEAGLTFKSSSRKQRTAPIDIVDSNATAVQLALNNTVASGKFEFRLMKSSILVSVPEPVDHSVVIAALNVGKFQF